MGDRGSLLTVTGTTTMGQKRIENFPYSHTIMLRYFSYYRSTKTRPITAPINNICVTVTHAHIRDWMVVRHTRAHSLHFFEGKLLVLLFNKTGQIAKMHTFYSANVTSLMACFRFDFCQWSALAMPTNAFMCVCVWVGIIFCWQSDGKFRRLH